MAIPDLRGRMKSELTGELFSTHIELTENSAYAFRRRIYSSKSAGIMFQPRLEDGNNSPDWSSARG